MKTFYIDHVERKGDTTILKCYVVDAETFEEAIALHDTDWENYHGKAVFPPEIAHCAENLVDGWSLRLVEEERDIDPEASRIRQEKLREENPELFEEEEMCDCDCCNWDNL
jgi:hypothetical protein